MVSLRCKEEPVCKRAGWVEVTKALLLTNSRPSTNINLNMLSEVAAANQKNLLRY